MTAKYLGAILLLAGATVSVHAETFACDLKALTPEQRKEHQKLSKELASAVSGLRELPDGYTLQIDSTKLPLVGIAQWITLERRCCPFLRFRIDVETANDTMSLSLQGAPGVKKFIEMEFRLGKS